MRQAEAVNSKGVYVVGKLNENVDKEKPVTLFITLFDLVIFFSFARYLYHDILYLKLVVKSNIM